MNQRAATGKSVLTLMAPPDAPLEEGRIGPVIAALEAAGAQILGQEWLAQGKAYDIHFKNLYPEAAQTQVEEALAGARVDVIAQAAGTRRKMLLVADMESTIIEQEMLDELADFVGKRAEVEAITARAMNGELDFAAALTERVRLLSGLPESVLADVSRRITHMLGAKELVATMRAHGAYCVLVSGGFTYFTSQVRDALGFDEARANQLLIAGGKISGEVGLPILDKHSKLHALMELSGARGVPVEESLAVGDGANDLPMLLAAGLGVAYHAKPSVQAATRHRVTHCDLTALLYAQGYRAEEIVS